MEAQSRGPCPRHRLGREQFEVTKVIRHPFGKALAREIADWCRQKVHETLQVCADLPLKVTDPDWMERLEEEA